MTDATRDADTGAPAPPNNGAAVGVTALAQRVARPVKWVSILVILACVFLIMRQLPLQEGIAFLKTWIDRFGVWGPVIYGLIYIAGVILLAPGSVMTIGAAVIFGFWTGLLTVWFSATIGAALALLIARYLARKRIEKLAERSPKFAAMDKAVREGGWKIVAMLRLSPAVPFNLQNYFYGLTAIRFWPCVLTSWIAMLPGTVLFVYLGYLTRTLGEQAASQESSFNIGKWVMLGLGLTATVVVSVYITKLARKQLKQQTDIKEPRDMSTSKQDQTASQSIAAKRWPWGATAAALLALVFIGGALAAPLLGGLFGPGAVDMKEAYAADAQGKSFDHSALDALLKKHLDAQGWVDYEALRKDGDALAGYIQSLGDADFNALSR